MSKYDALREHLDACPAGPIRLSFSEIDRIVGELPSSARRHRAWWSNERNGTHVQAHGWLGAKRRVVEVDLNGGVVHFSQRSAS